MKLEARNVSVAIPHAVTGAQIVSNASLSVSTGELVGLIGPNGAGKSTLLKAMLGLRPRDAGDILLDGADFLVQPPARRARNVAFLPQERHVEWRLPARDIVMLGRYPHRDRFGGATAEDRAAVTRALDAVDGHALVERPISVLSGGERTRILLARAGAGILAVIHDLPLATRFMDRLILMHEGQIIADGPPTTVLTPENLSRAYRIEALTRENAGETFVLPWTRRT